MSDLAPQDIAIHGSVAPGFESVRNLFEREVRSVRHGGTQLCVYRQGDRVVDLWASATNDPEFSADSIVNVFSSGKSLTTIAIAALVGRGLLDYDARVTDYWPEFGAKGKGELTVADVMRHEAGIAALDTPIEPKDLLRESIKENAVGRILETHAQKFRQGQRGAREYHAVTRGWIANEIFRRADPGGRTIGEFLAEEITGPLEVDASIGVDEEDLGRISPVSPFGIRRELSESFKPEILGRRTLHGFPELAGRLMRIVPSLRHATTRGAPPPFKGMKNVRFFNEPAIARGETPSANATCSARGLAKIAAMMAARGTWGERPILAEDAWTALHANPVRKEMGLITTEFTQGGVNAFTEAAARGSRIDRAFNKGREGFYGWMGLGGSVFQWNPEHRIGFGYVPTSLHVLDLMNERGKVYQAEVLRCLSASP